MDYEREGEVEAPFNMAIATLKRLDIILQQIRNLDLIYTYDSPEKQKSYINLVKQFYINAIPLFPKVDKDTEADAMSEKILNLKIVRKNMIKSGSQTYNHIYSEELDKTLNQILIEIQIKLRKFFMPTNRDDEGL